MSNLEFEKPVLELESKIRELRATSGEPGFSIVEEINRMERKIERILKSAYESISPDQKVQVARHADRPHFLDYAAALVSDFTPLAGDRSFGEDKALVGGLGRFRGRPCVVMGQERGSDTASRLKHNFGMARPEGYRKAQRLMHMADQFGLPVITLCDTAGAYPGVDAEERGQSEAIARSIETCLSLGTPIVCTIIGEGGSGGAIAIATGNKVFMMEHAVYSVISPEGCASILWRAAAHAKEAAIALKITAQDMLGLGLIDGIVQEGLGGAHRNRDLAIRNAGDTIEAALKQMEGMDAQALRQQRREKFLAMGRIQQR
ncbi:MAG: acetyl-CoA carboxylase carboxyltransferase subunit alpha [Alphaproteobacteria bacterium]|nr:acetyl-CoA carboxylase carboxyltransferase subunit alpha [Alphaproteobacteria bacterium]